MHLFLNGVNVFGANDAEKFTPTPTVTSMVDRRPAAVLTTCPDCPPAPKWPWILAAITGTAVGVGIAAAAIGSREKR